MISDEIIRKISLFYFFSLLNDQRAVYASAKTVRLLRKCKFSNQAELEKVLISECHRNWRKYGDSKSLVKISHENWKLPNEMTLGSWRAFRSKATDEEFVALIWSRVLGFPEEVIADGLGLSLGTLRHRISFGLRKLGQIEMENSANV